MRKIIVVTMLSLDGVMQGPGGPTEDTSGNFTLGGWTFPYVDEFFGDVMGEEMGHPFDLLLGRKTFEIFASYWPQHLDVEAGAAFDRGTKYVASNTLKQHDWQTTIFLSGDVPELIRNLKEGDGPELQVYGSAKLIQTLMAHDLVDEFWLRIFPVTLATGKRLFAEGTTPAAYTLVESKTSPSGVIFATLKRAGEVKTGSF